MSNHIFSLNADFKRNNLIEKNLTTRPLSIIRPSHNNIVFFFI